MPGTVIGIADTMVNKTGKAPALSKITPILVGQSDSVKL